MVKVDGIDGKIGVVYSFYSATAISVNYTMQMFAFEDLGGSFELYKQKMFSDYVIDKSVYADIASKCFTGMEQKNICAFGDSITAQAKWYEVFLNASVPHLFALFPLLPVQVLLLFWTLQSVLLWQ